MELNDIYDRAILTEGRMKELSWLLDSISRDAKTAEASFDLQSATVTLHFELQGERGWVKLHARGEDPVQTLRRKLFAAAVSEMKGGRPRNLRDAIAATRRVHPHALQILTNRDEFDLVGAEWDKIEYGLQNF